MDDRRQLCLELLEGESAETPTQSESSDISKNELNNNTEDSPPQTRAIRFLLENRASIPTRIYEFQKPLYAILQVGLRLLALEGECLSSLNQIGIYHKFKPAAGKVFENSISIQSISSAWIYRGSWPGIWCTLYSPCYTFTYYKELVIGRVEFAPGYKLYDPKSREHTRLWEDWKSKETNRKKVNEWEWWKNSEGQSLRSRVEHDLNAPGYRAFYREHNFGAIIGTSDYMAVVIIEERLVQVVSDALAVESDGGK